MQVGDILVNRLSGPASVYYMKPSALKVNGMDCPLVLLFGDIHFSYENACDPCDQKEGCYALHDREFLENIDKLAEEYPIDFFTESNPITRPPLDQGFLFGKLMNTTRKCHQAKDRSTREYSRFCPTRNVRWHYVDSRFFGKVEQNLIGAMFYLLDNPNAKAEYLYNQERLIQILAMAVMDDVPYEDIMDELADYMVTTLMVEGGLSYKQRYPNFMEFTQLWKGEYYHRKIKDKLKIIRDTAGIPYTFGMFFLEGYDALDKNVLTEEHIKPIRDLLIILEAPILDIYQISRMLKKPKDNTNSYLSLGFFGNAHIINIQEFLQKVLGYGIVYKRERKASRRCVSFDEPIDLMTDLKQYHREDLHLYIKQLERERNSIEGIFGLDDPKSNMEYKKSYFSDRIEKYLLLAFGETSLKECVHNLVEEIVVKWCKGLFSSVDNIVVASIVYMVDESSYKFKDVDWRAIKRMINYIKKRKFTFRKYGKNKCVSMTDSDQELLTPEETKIIEVDGEIKKIFKLNDPDHLEFITEKEITDFVKRVLDILVIGQYFIDDNIFNCVGRIIRMSVNDWCAGVYNALYKNSLVITTVIVIVKSSTGWSDSVIIDSLERSNKVDIKVVIPMVNFIERRLGDKVCG